MTDACFCSSTVLGKESMFLQNLSKNKTSSGNREGSYTKQSYFCHSNISLQHQIFQGLAGPVVLVAQAATLMLGEASSSSKNMLHVSLL